MSGLLSVRDLRPMSLKKFYPLRQPLRVLKRKRGLGDLALEGRSPNPTTEIGDGVALVSTAHPIKGRT